MSNNEHLLKFSIPQLLRWRVAESPKRTALRERLRT